MENHADNDLRSVQKYSHRKQWSVLKLSRNAKTNPLKHGLSSFEKKLLRQIRLYFDKAELHVLEHQHALWLRISIPPVRQVARPTRNTATYFVHPPNTDYLLVANLKVSQAKHLTQALMSVLGAYRIEQLFLKGRHISSLLQLVLNKHTQGQYSKYYGKKSNKSVPGGGKRRSSDVQDTDSDTELDSRIVQENAATQRRRRRHLEENFGTGSQPLLEKIEYKLETNFKGAPLASTMDTNEIFHCRVKFEGPSVIEGIRNLAKAGLAPVPMKDHLANVHTLARNTFVLRQKSSST